MLKKSSKSRRYKRKQRGGKKRSTRKSGGISSKLFHPVGEILDATGETIGEVGSTAGNVAKRTIKGASEIGRVWTRHVNSALSLKGK